MAYAENKSLTEYGDLKSEHHIDKQVREEEERRRQEELQQPPRMVVVDGPGNLYRVKWTHGDMELPFEVHGDWNHKGKATEAIRGAEARLRNDAKTARILEEAAAAEAAEHEAEVAAEQERLQQEAMEAMADAEAEASRQERGVTKEEDEAALAAEVAKPKAPARKKAVRRKTK